MVYTELFENKSCVFTYALIDKTLYQDPGKMTFIHQNERLTGLQDLKVVPKAFQINILTFPGTNPSREQVQTWWRAEKEAGLSLLAAAIQTNKEVIARMERNIACIQMEISDVLENTNMGHTNKEMWKLFAKKTIEGLETTTQE